MTKRRCFLTLIQWLLPVMAVAYYFIPAITKAVSVHQNEIATAFTAAGALTVILATAKPNQPAIAKAFAALPGAVTMLVPIAAALVKSDNLVANALLALPLILTAAYALVDEPHSPDNG